MQRTPSHRPYYRAASPPVCDSGTAAVDNSQGGFRVLDDEKRSAAPVGRAGLTHASVGLYTVDGVAADAASQCAVCSTPRAEDRGRGPYTGCRAQRGRRRRRKRGDVRVER